MRLIYIKVFRPSKRFIALLLTLTGLLFGTYYKVAGQEEAFDAEAVSWKVANRLIVIDPGHGGIDPGAIGSGGTLEKDVVLDISKKLKTLLSQAGAVVVMTRETDKDLSDPSGSVSKRKHEDLARRVELANSKKADIYLGIHGNSFPSPIWRGAQVFYQHEQEDGKKLAECIQAELRRVLKNTDRQAKAGDYYINRNTKMTSVIVEVGFFSNPDEERLMKDRVYQQKVAYAIYAGVAKYFAGD